MKMNLDELELLVMVLKGLQVSLKVAQSSYS